MPAGLDEASAVDVVDARFAPGHVGELTQIVPFEMVDAALEETGAAQRRLRDLPSRVVVYLLLAGCLFPEVGYPGVWRKLTAGAGAGAVAGGGAGGAGGVGGVGGVVVAEPSASAMAQARRRLGPAPLRWLFEMLRGPVARPGQRGVWWHGLLVCAIDGTIVTVTDSDAVRTRYSKQPGSNGGTGYPQVRLLALVACGTRALIDVVFGTTSLGETTYTPRLLGSMRAGMIVLADRNFAAQDLLSQIAGTGAHLVVRCKNARQLPVLKRYADGSYLSTMGPLRVRVVDAEITISTTAGRRSGRYRLITTLLDPQRYPAGDLVRLYHERWEIETVYLELKSSMLGGRVLRARTPAGIEQEVYALLVTYQLLRTAIADATTACPDVDPDRASFTIAWQAARDQVILAGNVIATTVVDLLGAIGAHVLAHPLPPRRERISPPHRQTSKLQVPGQRRRHRPSQLQSHPEHRHPHRRATVTTKPRR